MLTSFIINSFCGKLFCAEQSIFQCPPADNSGTHGRGPDYPIIANAEIAISAQFFVRLLSYAATNLLVTSARSSLQCPCLLKPQMYSAAHRRDSTHRRKVRLIAESTNASSCICVVVAKPVQTAPFPTLESLLLKTEVAILLDSVNWRCAVDKLLRYIESTEKRNKIIDVVEKFCIVGGTILTVIVLWAKFF